MRPTKTWILIANASQARIVENDGPGKGIFQLAGKVFKAEPETGFDDQPGRSFQSKGTRRSGMEPHQKSRTAVDGFAAQMIDQLAAANNKAEFDRLIVCAPPAILGNLRQLLPDNLKAKVSAELSKDLTHVPTDELASHFEAVLAV